MNEAENLFRRTSAFKSTALLVPRPWAVASLPCRNAHSSNALIAVQANHGDPGLPCQTQRGTPTSLVEEPPLQVQQSWIANNHERRRCSTDRSSTRKPRICATASPPRPPTHQNAKHREWMTIPDVHPIWTRSRKCTLIDKLLLCFAVRRSVGTSSRTVGIRCVLCSTVMHWLQCGSRHPPC